MSRSPFIYLDNNATTPLDPAVLEAMLPYLSSLTANPASRHGAGRTARRAVERACQVIATGLGVDPDGIAFTSGATESNNLAIRQPFKSDQPLVRYLATEHPSALEPTKYLDQTGAAIRPIDVDGNGRGRFVETDFQHPSPSLVVAQLANSETGVLQDIQTLAEMLCPETRLHVDAVQAIGRVPVDFHSLGATTMSISGHKIHGPPGIGALFFRRGSKLTPLLDGGSQQEGIRPGSEPVALIVGLAKAVELAVQRLDTEVTAIAAKRDRFEQRLCESIPDTYVNGAVESRLPNTTNLSFVGAKAEAVLIALDLSNIYASAGTACASGSLEPSPVLIAMGLPPARVESAIRFSLSRLTTDEALDRAIAHISRAVEQVRHSLKSTSSNSS